ncbi:MAG: hypothetical protein J2P37_13205 [Ktedonobacteraceae bacterium]|nr:hypothetical protein [Ktedonobacteraceae bacterium]
MEESTINEIVTHDGYIIQPDLENPGALLITNSHDGQILRLTVQEAIDLLKVMLRRQDDLHLLRSDA